MNAQQELLRHEYKQSCHIYNEAEQRYEMPFGHLVVYANVRKEKRTLFID